MRARSFILTVGILVVFVGVCMNAWAADYDILIKNGKVFDGTLKPAFRADVAVKDGMIVRVARSIEGSADRMIDARGLHVSPGFIDLHTHVERGMYFPENRACLNYLKQGVTSVIVGQCGSSAWPIFEKAEDQVARWTEEGIGPNAALLVGHGTVRRIVMGMEDREPTPEELEAMKVLVREAMEQGACGLSTGLIYRPSRFGKTDEIIELAKVVAEFGGIYHTHIRDERANLMEAVSEAIAIAEAAGIRGHISHFKVLGKANWGLVNEACRLIEDARARGLRITADQYPYRFSSNYPYRRLIPTHVWRGEEDAVDRLTTEDIEGVFANLRDAELVDLYRKVAPEIELSDNHQAFLDALPRRRLVGYVASQFVRAGDFSGPENARDRMLFMERMADPEESEKIKAAVRKDIEDLVGPENILIAMCVDEELEGLSLIEAARLKGKPFEVVAIELELMGARCVPLQMSEEDIETILSKDYVTTGSDGTAPSYGIGLPHVRSYSTFLHKLKKYGQEREAASLAHIIRSQTSLPAEIMEWEDRGRIDENFIADIVILDLKHIETPTSISNPHRYSSGVTYLMVNGELVIEEGEYNGTLAGDVIMP